MSLMRNNIKAGDSVIWFRSPGRSFLTGWRVQQIPASVVCVLKHRIRIRIVRSDGTERLVNVDPENILLCGLEESTAAHKGSVS
jgi:hypothetical protein